MKQFFRIIYINFLVLLAGILMLELIFGGWLRDKSLRNLNLVIDRAMTFDASGLYPAEKDSVQYRRDQYGFRGKYKSASAIDILTIGGSTTDQRYISEGETWQDVLAERFREQGKDISVVNAGVDGQSTVGHIKNFESWFPKVPDLHARYYLFYLGINDFYVREGNVFDDLKNSLLVNAIRKKSALYRLYLNLRGLFEANFKSKISHRKIDFSQVKWTDKPLSADYESLMADRLSALRGRIHVLAEDVRKRGGELIIVTQPVSLFRKSENGVEGVDAVYEYDGRHINGYDIYFMMQMMYAAMMDACRDESGICIDLANEANIPDSDYYDFYHLVPGGAEKVGTYLHEKLRSTIQ